MFSVIAALVALPFVAQSAFAADDCARTYTVKAGDYCDKISVAHNVSTYQLAVVNPSINAACDNLQPDQTLCLGKSGEDCQTTYQIKADDTCDQITQVHAINSTILYANNPQINADCSNIYIGEVLCVGTDFAAPPAPSVIPATAIPSGATPAVAKTTSASSTVSATPSPTPTSDDDDEDDEDLPFCDEL